MDPLLDDGGCSPTSTSARVITKMGLDDAFSALGWGKDAWPSEQELRQRHKEHMLKYHPDKAPEGKVEEYTERASRLNRAKEIILRAQGLSDDGDAAQADFFCFDPFSAAAQQSTAMPSNATGSPRNSRTCGASASPRPRAREGVSSLQQLLDREINNLSMPSALSGSACASSSLPSASARERAALSACTSAKKPEEQQPVVVAAAKEEEDLRDASWRDEAAGCGGAGAMRAGCSVEKVAQKSVEGEGGAQNADGHADSSSPAESGSHTAPHAVPHAMSADAAVRAAAIAAQNKNKVWDAQSMRWRTLGDQTLEDQPLKTLGDQARPTFRDEAGDLQRTLRDEGRDHPPPAEAPHHPQNNPQKEGGGEAAHHPPAGCSGAAGHSGGGMDGDGCSASNASSASSTSAMRGEGGASRSGGMGGGCKSDDGGKSDEWDDEDECVYVTPKQVVPAWEVIRCNLKLLADIRDRDKLVIAGDTVRIDAAGVLGSVTRWLSSQGRTQTMSWLARFAHDLIRFHSLLALGVGVSTDCVGYTYSELPPSTYSEHPAPTCAPTRVVSSEPRELPSSPTLDSSGRSSVADAGCCARAAVAAVTARAPPSPGASGGYWEAASHALASYTSAASPAAVCATAGGEEKLVEQKHVRTREEVLTDLRRELGPCVEGLCRLRTTYADDRWAVQRMDKIVADLSALLITLKTSNASSQRSTYP